MADEGVELDRRRNDDLPGRGGLGRAAAALASAPSAAGVRRLIIALAMAALLLLPLATSTAHADGSRTIGAPGPQPCGDPITFGYYRQWRDVATTKEEDRNSPGGPNVQKLSDVPPEIDVVSMFATKPDQDPDMWQALKDSYLPALHAQGTEVVFTLWIDDFAHAPVEDTQAAYQAYAQQIYDTYIGYWGVDGIDIDVESTPTGAALDRAIGIITELGKLIGPQSGSGKYFIYDTNLTGDHPVFVETAQYFDYVLLQAYGRNVSTIQGTWETFAPRISSCQFLLGFSFYEERDPSGGWGDAVEPFETSRAVQYAKWQPFGGEKGGFFAYAIDRDGKQPGDDTISKTDFSWMKRLDAIALDVVGAHLPAVDRGVDLAGRLELDPDANYGRIGDLTAHGDHAYVTAAGGSTCDDTGIHVVDLSDPAAPVEVADAFIPADPGNLVGEGAQVAEMDNEYFSGDLLVHGNRDCIAPAPTGPNSGGVSLWDVTDPADPQPIVAHVGDSSGETDAPDPVHGLRLWTNEFDGHTYVAITDGDSAAVDILDVTDPFHPVIVNDDVDLEAFGVGQESPVNLTEVKAQQLSVTFYGDRYLMAVSAFDGGQVLLDVTDPTDIGLIAESDYAELDEERLARGEEISPGGNAHQAALAPNKRYLLGIDEDATPQRSVTRIDDGPYAGDAFEYLEGANTPSIAPGTSISGPTTFVGLACEPVPAGDGTALIERGTCTFQTKVDNVTAAGYDAGIVFNHADGCNALQGMSMSGSSIPYVFVARETGLKLLGQSDLDCSNAVAIGTPSHAATIGKFRDGFGYARLFRTSISPKPGSAGSIRQIDTYAVPESQDPAHATGSGNLSAHQVALDPDNSEIAYLAYNAAGLRVVRYGKVGIQEIGAFIDEGGSNVVGVEVWTDESGEQYVLASDRDFGLYVFMAR